MIPREALAQRIIRSLRAIKDSGLDLDAADLAEAIDVDIDIAVGQILLAYPWDFAVAWDTVACVADEDEYTLKGRDQECWSVFEVKYGTGANYDSYIPLTKKRPADLSDYSALHSMTEVEVWAAVGRDGRFPRIRVVAAPSSADYSLRYGYHRAGIGYNELPSDAFIAPIIMGVRWLWGFASEQEFADSITRVIGGYDRPAQPEERKVILDPLMRARNRLRNRKFGYLSAGSDYTVLKVEEK